MLSNINLVLGFQALEEQINSCPLPDGSCTVPRRDRGRFMALTGVPEAFQGRSVLAPTVEDIDGLTIGS